MRRVGKSTAVKYILKQLDSLNYLSLDYEQIEIRVLLNGNNYEGIKSELELIGLDFSLPAIVALDEIQLVENLPSVIKYFFSGLPGGQHFLNSRPATGTVYTSRVKSVSSTYVIYIIIYIDRERQ